MKKILLALLTAVCGTVLLTSSNVANAEANDVVISPFAHYEFEDASNPGKDSSKHGFDLSVGKTSASATAIQMLDDNGDGYVSLRRDQYDTGVSKNMGAWLYAPQQGDTPYDFSDMITGSYTVSFTFKANSDFGHGDVYALTFGRYTSCYTITPWAGGVEIQLNNVDLAPGETFDEKQKYVEANKKFYAVSTKDWCNITLTADATTNTHTLYFNGQLLDTLVLPGVKLSSSANDDYTFAIGAQSNIYGNSATQYGNVDVKELAIYDCALSSDNVAAILAGNDAKLANQPADEIYVESIEELDLEEIDLEITDVNTLSDLMSTGLPTKVKATTSNGVQRSYPVYWYGGSNQKICGYIQTGYTNAELKEIELSYNYVAKFDYDADLVTIKNVQLDGVEYVPGTPITSSKHLLSFELELKDGAKLESVEYWDMEVEEEDGVYYADILEGGLVYINAKSSTYTVTYMDGTEKLSTSKYTAGGNEQLKEFPKDGYTFAGWYLDAELTQEFQGLDYKNPKNITLYAKYVPASSAKKGCGGAIATSIFGISILAAGLFVSKKKRK